ncbi:MAG: helix-turn-helix domain-containing protein [Solirubrobacteraceae bacterium]
MPVLLLGMLKLRHDAPASIHLSRPTSEANWPCYGQGGRRRAKRMALDVLHPQRRSPPSAHADEALPRIGAHLQGAPGDIDDILELVVDQAAALLQTDLAWLALATDDGTAIRPAVVRGFRDSSFLEVTLEVGRGVGGVAIAEQRVRVVDDYAAYAHDTNEAARRGVISEGIVSIICAPMLRDDTMVGALYVGNRTSTPFADVHVALLSALASQASIAIHNRRLCERMAAQNDLLQRAFDVHRQLAQASLEGLGLAGIGDVLAQLIGHPIVIEQSTGDPRWVCCPMQTPPAGPGTPSIARAIVAGNRRLGSIEVIGTSTLTPLQAQALEHGTTVLALELVKQRSASEVEWRLSGEFLDELLDHPGTLTETLERRARHLGVDIGSPHRMLALAPDANQRSPSALLAIVRRLIIGRAPYNVGNALSGKRGSLVLLALPAALEGDAVTIARDIQGAMAADGATASVGVGPLKHDFRETYRGAAACLALATYSGVPGTIVELDTLGPLRFLLDASDIGQAAGMIREALDPVTAHDSTARTPLLPTLRAFVELGGHYMRTAEHLFVSVSTLKYRLRKLREVLGESPSNPDLHFRLRLAFSLLDLVQAMGMDDGQPWPVSRE